MGMGRPAYARGQGSFFGGESPSGSSPFGGGIGGGLYGAFRPMRSPRMPMPPMNKPLPFMPQSMPQSPQMPMDGGYDGSGFMGGLMAKMPPPQMNFRMPTPSMNQDQTPSDGGFLSQLVSSPMMQRPMPQMPGGPGKGRPRGGLMQRGRGRGRGRGSLMRGGPGKGRGQPQMPMPQQPFMGRVGNNMPQPKMTTFMPTRNMGYEGGFYGGGITDLY